MQTCISDGKTWLMQNKLKLNNDKTEALLVKSQKTIFPDAQPTSLHVGTAAILFMMCAHNLCFISDNRTFLQHKHILTVYHSAYMEIDALALSTNSLTVEATVTLACAFVLSRFDYCNSLLSGCPLYPLSRLHKVQNSAAKLVFKVCKHDHVQPLLQAPHWLLVQARTDYKLSTICHNFFSDSSPVYF